MTLLAFALGCAHPDGSALAGNPKEPTLDSSATLDLVARIMAARPFHAADVAKLAGMTIEPATQGSNAFFTVYQSKQAGAFATLEVREPTAQAAGKSGMVIVGLAPDPCLDRATVGARFGAAPVDTIVPRPGQPAGTPTYERYPQDWGEVRLGWADNGCLASVVLDGNAR